MTENVVVIEQEGAAWGAYVPDLPGCVAAGRSRDEVEELIAEAIPLHLRSLREHGEHVPPSAAMGSRRRYGSREHGIDGSPGKALTGFTVLGGPLAVSTAVIAAMETDLAH